jgi:lipoprotein-anchoring transpeptidase ErfK/SrfK
MGSTCLKSALALMLCLSVSLPAQALPPGWRFLPPPGVAASDAQTAQVVMVRSSNRIPAQFKRQVVQVMTDERPGTIIIDTSSHFLYYVLGGGEALRYGIGVAKSGFEWRGTHRISRKAEWPSWTPPAAMLKRRPDLPRHMEGGINNPLGARALYLGSTLYRIHGTNEPWTIGQNVSSGCIRMTNEDVVDLYDRVQLRTKVIVL